MCVENVIYYHEDPPMGAFNGFINNRHLVDVARFISANSRKDAPGWRFSGLPKEELSHAVLTGIRLDSTRAIFVDEYEVYFCSRFSCEFSLYSLNQSKPAREDGIWLDVDGRIEFHENAEYDFALLGIHPYYNNARPEEIYIPSFPGVWSTQLLIPNLSGSEQEIERKRNREAVRFLSRYYPAALKQSIPVPIRSIAENGMKMNIITDKRLVEQSNTMGMVLFKTTEVTVEDEETGEKETHNYPRGTALIDPDVMWSRGYGSFNYTIGHEAYHYFSLKAHMAFMKYVSVPDDYAHWKEIMEAQAQSMSGHILMPAEATQKVYHDHVALYTGPEETDTQELAAAATAVFFRVSKTAMKIRLAQLGLYESERKSAGVRCRVEIHELFHLYATDKGFRALLDDGIYRYVEGYVVKNEMAYIKGDSLTDYAKEHLTDCTIVFHECRRIDGELSYSLFRDEYFILTADYDARMSENPKVVKMQMRKLSEAFNTYTASLDQPLTFSQYMMPILTEANTEIMGPDIRNEYDDAIEKGLSIVKRDRWTSRYIVRKELQTGKKIRITEADIFQTKTLIGYKEFEKMRRDDKNDPSVETIIAICAGYHLPFEQVEKALYYAGHRLIHIRKHLAYQFLMTQCRTKYEDTDTFNTLLIYLGEEPVGTRKKKSKDEY